MAALPEDWALPELTRWNEAWFTSGSIAIQRCTACATLQHPPEEICHACGGTAFDTVVLAPRGTVHSYTIVHYAANPALAGSVPYAVVLVSLDDAPDVRVVGNLLADGDETSRPTIGMPVEAEWAERTAADGRRILLPQWRASPGSSGAPPAV
jgi:uncharacterized OB-fold protein